MVILTNLKINMTIRSELEGKIGKITEDESNQQFKMGHYVKPQTKIRS